MTAALSGANLIHDVGYLESGLNGSLDMLVFSDEAISMVKRLIGGVRVTPETLAVDVIRDVGPGGHYLQHDHTVRHFRDEIWRPQLLNRSDHFAWQQAGSKTLAERVHNEVLRILAEHQPAPIAAEAMAAMRKIVDKAEGR